MIAAAAAQVGSTLVHHLVPRDSPAAAFVRGIYAGAWMLCTNSAAPQCTPYTPCIILATSLSASCWPCALAWGWWNCSLNSCVCVVCTGAGYG